MLQFAALFLAQMNTVALAEEPYERAKPWRYEKYLGTVDEVIHNGPTELPLYNQFSGRAGSLTALPFENEEGESREWLTVFASSFPYIVVSSDFAQYMGATVKTTNKTLIPIWNEYKLGGQIDYVVFDELTIGNMTLRNVTAAVMGHEDSAEYIEGFDSNAHILIGFNQLESAYQVLPSEGTIKFEGTADGSALMSEYGNAIGYQNYTGGKYKFFKTDTLINSGTLMIDVKVDGEPRKLLLETSRKGTLSRIKEGTGTFHLNDFDGRYSSFEFGTFQGETLTKSFDFDWKIVPHDGIIGLDLLNNYDIAVDVGNQQVAFRPIQSEQKRLSFLPIQLAQVQAKIDEKLNAEASEEEECACEPTAQDWKELASFQSQMGQLDAAYESTLKRTELAPNSCAAWLKASEIALKLNKVTEAKDHAEKSSSLYHSWWTMDLVTRQDIQSRQNKMKPEAQEEAKEAQKSLAADAEPVWHYTQPGFCHEADAQLAWTYIALDQLEKVLPLYRERIDLDENLALAAAYSAILQNDLPLAQETLRQAIKLGKGYSPDAKAALTLWYADVGDTEQFERLIYADNGSGKINTGDELFAALMVDNYRQIHGPEKTLAFIESRLKVYPTATTYHYLNVRELKLAGAGSAYDDAVAKADQVFQSEMLNYISPNQPLTNIAYNSLCNYASYLILTDRLEAAERIINDQLKKVQFNYGEMALTMANYYIYKGDMNSAMTEFSKFQLDGRGIYSLSSAFLLREPAASAE